MFVDKSDAGLEAAFAKMDKNNNGKINTAELKAYILQSYGSTIVLIFPGYSTTCPVPK